MTDGNDMMVVKQQPLTAAEVRANVNRIQEVMKAVMKEDTHFGIIPGCKKPSLYKPGSEILLSTFHIAIEPVVVDLSTADEVRYRVEARATNYSTGTYLGSGIGECSSSEEKYKWRKVVCDEEFAETPEDRKREKWGVDYKSHKSYKTKQVRTNIADVANTILKMAKKRSQIDVTLTVTAASDIFTQDIEDIPEEVRDIASEKPQAEPIRPPQRKSESASQPASAPAMNGDTISEPQQKRLFAIAINAGFSTEQIKDELVRRGIEHTANIKKVDYNEIVQWFENGGGMADEPGANG